VADFADNAALRHDFVAPVADARSILDFCRATAAIHQRLSVIPWHGRREDRVALSILRLAYSRDRALQASFAPGSPLLVDYELLGRQPALRQELEHLAQLGLLRRRHFTRTHACVRCGSARLHAYEACPACGGGELLDEQIVHHYRCGAQEPESHFTSGHELICPKCRRVLRHFGVDYDKPGTAVVCQNCRAVSAAPATSFACLDCAAVTPGDTAAATDWYHYDLAEDGIRALHAGRLPGLDIATLVDGRSGAFQLSEFRLLAGEALRVAQRYSRPFAMTRIAFADIEELRRTLGPVQLDAAFRLAANVILESLRDSDFVTASGVACIMIGMPETSVAVAEGIVTRLRETLAAGIAGPVRIEAHTVEGPEVLTLLDAHQP
jgi:GGDEF domain-containing protein